MTNDFPAREISMPAKVKWLLMSFLAALIIGGLYLFFARGDGLYLDFVNVANFLACF